MREVRSYILREGGEELLISTKFYSKKRNKSTQVFKVALLWWGCGCTCEDSIMRPFLIRLSLGRPTHSIAFFSSSAKFPSIAIASPASDTKQSQHGGVKNRSEGQKTVRRRRGNTSSTKNESRIPPPPNIITTNDFIAKSIQFFAKLEEAVQPMIPSNPDIPFFITNKDNNSVYIDLGPTHGTYTFSRHDPSKQIMVSSPISGINKYVYCASSNSFVGEVDSHSLEGIFCRDIIRQVNGYPNF